MNYDVDYFIAKFEVISEEKWTRCPVSAQRKVPPCEKCGRPNHEHSLGPLCICCVLRPKKERRK